MEQTNQLVVLYMCIRGLHRLPPAVYSWSPWQLSLTFTPGGKQMRDLCVSACLPLRAARGNTTEIKAPNGWEKTARRRHRGGKGGERDAKQSVKPSPHICLDSVSGI